MGITVLSSAVCLTQSQLSFGGSSSGSSSSSSSSSTSNRNGNTKLDTDQRIISTGNQFIDGGLLGGGNSGGCNCGYQPTNTYPSNNYPSNNQQQQCQCNNNLTFRDKYGNTHGACRRADETGRTWCYTYGGCPDSRPSQRYPNNPWSYQACNSYYG